MTMTTTATATATAHAHAVFVDRFQPAAQRSRLAMQAVLVLAGSLLIAASAQVALPLFFSPVPITGQTFAVLLIGALFGPRLGMATVVAYLLEGAAGLPVFAGGGLGAPHLVGPTAGYLFGFIPAVALVGWMAARGWDRTVFKTVIAMALATAIIFASGLAWLKLLVGAENALALGLYPFVPGAIIKIALAAIALPGAWKAVEWFERSR